MRKTVVIPTYQNRYEIRKIMEQHNLSKKGDFSYRIQIDKTKSPSNKKLKGLFISADFFLWESTAKQEILNIIRDADQDLIHKINIAPPIFGKMNAIFTCNLFRSHRSSDPLFLPASKCIAILRHRSQLFSAGHRTPPLIVF
jgi:hypothetical protein